jgi:hypothetical protein
MTEVAIIPQDRFNVAKLADLELPESYDQMLALLNESGIEIDNAAGVLADEWPLLEKKVLVNVPLILATWVVSEPGKGDNGGQYIVCRGMTKDGRRFRFADGSTGIFKQLVGLTKQRVQDGSATPNAGLLVNGGLTVSEYDYTDEKGKVTKAQTYYLSNAE